MHMKILIAFLAFTVSAFPLNAQNNNGRSGITGSLGAAVNYYYGPGDRNFGKFDNDRINGQLNGMLGLTIARDKNDRRTMLGGFGTFGINNAKTMNQIFDDQDYITLATDQNSSNNFYQLEGGILISEIFRISTGVGRQIFDKQVISSSGVVNLDATSLKYNSTTVGFNFNVGAVALTLNCNFNYGLDYNKTVLNPSAGLMFRL